MVEAAWVSPKAPDGWTSGCLVKEHEHVGVGRAFVPASREDATLYEDEDKAMAAVRKIGRRVEFAVFIPTEVHE